MTRSHLTLTQVRTLPIGLATNGTDTPTYHDQPSSLTTLQVDERCHGCPWPHVCETDRTCWQQEAHADWQPSRVDLPRTDRSGANTWTRDQILHAIRDFHTRTGRPPAAADMRHPMPTLHSLYRHYPTVNHAQDAAGVPRTRRGWKKRNPQPTSTNLNHN